MQQTLGSLVDVNRTGKADLLARVLAVAVDKQARVLAHLQRAQCFPSSPENGHSTGRSN